MQGPCRGHVRAGNVRETSPWRRVGLVDKGVPPNPRYLAHPDYVFYAAGRVGKPATCRYGIKSGNGQYPLGNYTFIFFQFLSIRTRGGEGANIVESE